MVVTLQQKTESQRIKGFWAVINLCSGVNLLVKMATMSESRLLDLIGQLKVATVVSGIVTMSLAAASFVHHDKPEEYFLAIVCIALLLSLIFIVLVLLGVIPVTDVWKKIDMVYHGLMAILIAIGVLIQLIKIIEHRHDVAAAKVVTRSFAMVFGGVETGIYGYIAWAIYKAPSV